MAKYLVTGGAGFIGSHLCEALLDRGDSVTVFDDLSTGRPENVPTRAKLIEGDVCDAASLTAAMHGMNGCFHLAAIASVAASNENWARTHQVNQTATINVFEAARDAGTLPVVFASSAAVYGASNQIPLSESAPTNPMTAYGADKLGCELHAAPAFIIHGVASTALRLFNVYGPRQDPKSPYSGVISIFADRLKQGQNITIHGDGAQTRDFVFVKDVCAAFLAAMRTTNDGYRSINVCTGKETAVLELAQTLAKITQYSGAFDFGPTREGDIPRSCGNPLKMQQLLSVTAATALEDGLRETLSFLQQTPAQL